MWSKPPSTKSTSHPQNEEYSPWRYTILSQVGSPSFSTTQTLPVIFQNESVDIDTEPSFSFDAELDDETIGKALSSPLFIQEREEPVTWRQAYHSHEESLLPAQSFFAHNSSGRPVHEIGSHQKRKSSREMENERIRILFLKDKKRANSC